MIGVLIGKGISDWQIFQQQDGWAVIEVSGIWKYEAKKSDCIDVFACVRREDSGEPIIWWTRCFVEEKKWSVSLKIPAGGLYQLETCMTINSDGWNEWAIRGDIVSHFGVGDIFVIAGQSNSAGYGKDFIYDPCQLGIHILKNDKKWHLAQHPLQDSTGADSPVNMDEGSTGHSLYLSFAKYLSRELHYPIGLVQTARGGSSLREWSPDKRGNLYDNLICSVKAVGRIKGMIWYQGCSDAVEEYYRQYYECFLYLRKCIMRELNVENLPVFLFQISKCLQKPEKNENLYWGMLREQMRRLGHIEDIYVIPTGDCVLSDFVHVSAKSNLVLGERLAKVVLKKLYYHTYMCEAPDIVRAEKTADREVNLTFSPVYDKLECFGCSPEKIALYAEDVQGELQIADYRVVDKNKLHIVFHRKIQGNCAVHGAYDKAVSGIIPVDYGTHLPMLSFYGVEVIGT